MTNKPVQLDMFTLGQDLPLFSGTPQPAQPDAFQPQPPLLPEVQDVLPLEQAYGLTVAPLDEPETNERETTCFHCGTDLHPGEGKAYPLGYLCELCYPEYHAAPF